MLRGLRSSDLWVSRGLRVEPRRGRERRAEAITSAGVEGRSLSERLGAVEHVEGCRGEDKRHMLSRPGGPTLSGDSVSNRQARAVTLGREI